jgi:hypothetical protein
MESKSERLLKKHIGKHMPGSTAHFVSKHAALGVLRRHVEVLSSRRKSFMNKWPIFLIANMKQNSARTNVAMVDGFEESVLLHSLRNKVRSCCRVVSGFDHLRS